MKYKILECIRQGQIGGGESHLLSLVSNLNREKFEPVVLSFTDGPMITELEKLGVCTHIIPTTRPFDIMSWRKVKKLLKVENPALVHAHGTRAASNVFRACSSEKTPWVYTIHGWSFHDDQKPWVRSARIAGERFLTRNSNQNISVSASNRDSGSILIPGFKSVVVNNGIDQTKFDPALYDNHLRTELGYADEDIIVLFIARFNVQKQPLTLIRAFEKAFRDNPRIKLLMVGEGDQRDEGIALANGSPASGAIKFLPFRKDVPELLAMADIYVLPSLWEGLPIGLLEAMSMGRAVIASDVDGTKEIIADRKNGLIVDPGRLEDELPGRIKEMAADPELRERLGKVARETVKERFNAVTMTRQIENIYMKLISNGI